MKFIKINDSMLDFGEYRDEVSALRFELLYELCEVMSKYGFTASQKKLRSFDGMQISLRHKRLVLRVEIEMNRE